jgi:phosphate transport system permease protein
MSVATQAGPPPGAGLPTPPRLTARSRPWETLIKGILALSAALSVAVTFGIIAAIIEPALKFFEDVPLGDFFTVDEPAGSDVKSAVLPLMLATLQVTAIALCVAVPLGLATAMYLSEYASPRARKWLKPTVELLAGIPSVVYGYFALFFVTPTVLNGWLGLNVEVYNLLSAGLVLGVMIIPTVASLSEDALSAVPQALRQGSLAMGANRMQTTLRVVLPAALSGVAAAVVLGLSRAVGETMIVAIAAGSGKNFTMDVTEHGMTMTGFIAFRATGEAAIGSTDYNMLFAVALLLFLMTMVINAISMLLVRRFRQEY